MRFSNQEKNRLNNIRLNFLVGQAWVQTLKYARHKNMIKEIIIQLLGCKTVDAVKCDKIETGTSVNQTVAVHFYVHGGKSGLRRAECRLTAGRREATESGTESITADGCGKPQHR